MCCCDLFCLQFSLRYVDYGSVFAQNKIFLHFLIQFYLEPREKLKEALKTKGVDKSSFLTIGHGEMIIVSAKDRGAL